MGIVHGNNAASEPMQIQGGGSIRTILGFVDHNYAGNAYCICIQICFCPGADVADLRSLDTNCLPFPLSCDKVGKS